MKKTQLPQTSNKAKPRIDAVRPLVVEVGKLDAVFGSKRDHHNCAMARACRRLPKVIDAQITRTVAYLEYDDRIVRYSNSSALEKAITGFDKVGGSFPEGTYVIRPFGPSQRLAAMHKRAKRIKKMVVDSGRRKIRVVATRKQPKDVRPQHRFVRV